MNRNHAIRGLKQLGQSVLTVGRYLHGDSSGERLARRHDATSSIRGRRPIVRRGVGEFGAEPRDPLEIMLLAGDREEFLDKSFWQDAETQGVTFHESRVDGTWDEEDANEAWK